MTALLVIGIIIASLFSWGLIGSGIAASNRRALTLLSYYHEHQNYRGEINWFRCQRPGLCEREKHRVDGSDYKGYFVATAIFWPIMGPFLMIYSIAGRSMNKAIDPDGYNRLSTRLAALERETQIGEYSDSV